MFRKNIKFVEESLTLNKLEEAIKNMLILLDFQLLSKGIIYLTDAIFIACKYPKKYLEMERIMRQVAAKNGANNYKNVQSTIDKCIKSTYKKQISPQKFKKVFPDFDIYKLSTKIFYTWILSIITPFN